MVDGAIVAEGPPAEVVNEELVAEVFGLECRVVPDPVAGTPLVIPVGARHRRPLVDAGTENWACSPARSGPA